MVRPAELVLTRNTAVDLPVTQYDREMVGLRAVRGWLRQLGRAPYSGRRDRVSEAGDRALGAIDGRGGF